MKIGIYPKLLVVFSIYGGMYVVSNYVLAAIPVFLLTFLRFAIAASILLTAAKIKKLRMIEKRDLKEILFVGVLGYFVSNSALMLGVEYSTASAASLINAMNPIPIVFFAWLILKEKLTPVKILSLLLAVAGAVVIIGVSSSGSEMLGTGFSVLSILTWGLVVMKVKTLGKKYHPIVITACGMAIGAACSLPLAAASVVRLPDPISWTWKLLLGIGILGIICSAFVHVLWNHCLSIGEASVCAMFYPVQPLVSVLLGWMLFKEQITISFFLGGICIAGGILLNALPDGLMSRKHIYRKT